MGKGFRYFFLGLFLSGVLLCLSFFLSLTFNKALVASSGGSNEDCLKCHRLERLHKVLPNGEKMALYVDPEGFKTSVHGSIDCLSCHADINVKEHPKPIKISSKKEYRKKVSANCVSCHVTESLSPIHKNIVRENKLSCAECHGSHYIQPIKEEFNKVAKDCLKCHRLERLHKVLPNGEKMALYVEEKRFYQSAHGQKVHCLFCHQDIDKSTHPKPIKIESRYAYSKEINRNCLICHPSSGLSSFHQNIVKEGKVLCSECHTSHYVKNMKLVKKQTQECIQCHKAERSPKVLANGDKMYLYVDPEKFALTPHAKTGCFACHYDIYNADFHPKPLNIKSLKDYTKEMASRCIKCHTYESISKHPGHAIVAKDKRFMCIDCHGYHTNIPVGGK
ncbi:hypothetical protein F1847_05565 [Thermodesulfobacterium sp. TA1]|uniref:cytochrome c3 family protein n=1 Tax=Thermodesulfobacterium sp. TA1 TaxID=2234087 RepID=UPI001231A4F9|nr:cytochrome c3 family protein [Thermodesulfobacterium sp. TA1]QER42234.1 hypothetical protein F1847_05565 [Thermodesulfobacterium sp. TA1]